MSGPNSDLPGQQVFDWLDAEAGKRAQDGLTHRLRPRGAEVAGLELAGDDYLGLARDKRVAGAAAAAALRWGAGATGSRVSTGTTEAHAELEHELARFCGTEAALVFSSGFAANLAAVTTLSGKDSAIVTDRHIHASLAEGCRSARADIAAVTHADPAAVAHALSTRRHQRALVVTDSVFSVEGDRAPLPQLSAACREHSAGLLVDDAHGFGVLGEGGRGACHEAGLAAEPDVVTTVSLATSLGSQGGAVLGPKRVIRHLVDTARGFVFDAAPAPACVAAARSALGILRDEPELAEKTRENAMGLSLSLRAAGIRASTPDAAVVSVTAPTADDALAWGARCMEQGVQVGCFGPPSAPDGISGLRLTARACLREEDIEAAAKVIAEAAPRDARE